MASVKLVDKLNPSEATEDFSDFFLTAENLSSFSLDVSNMTYEMVNGSENAANPFGNGGTLIYDDPEYPTQLWMLSANDTIKLQFLRMVREFDASMHLALDKKDCNGRIYAQYQFTLNRVAQ